LAPNVREVSVINTVKNDLSKPVADVLETFGIG
jgi:hypothetical protein